MEKPKQEADDYLYKRFHAGETLHVQSLSSGTRFYAKPEFVFDSILIGYSILDEQKKPVPGHYRKMMAQKDLREWLDGTLIECKEA